MRSQVDGADAAELTTSYPVWIWPNLLGLDAPVVGVVWQRFVATVHGVSVPILASMTLGLIVWSVYLTDRWLDARPSRPKERAARHQFTRRHRVMIGVAAVGTLVVAVSLLPWLPTRYLEIGAVVAVVLGGYFLSVHALGTGAVGDLIKTLSVGVLFGAGVAIPLGADRASDVLTWLPAVGAFAALCWLNCCLIADWESGAPAQPRRIVLIAGVAVCLALGSPRPIALAVLGATILLCVLHLARWRISKAALRVLADVALLTPLVMEW
jgi:hypothetical protein